MNDNIFDVNSGTQITAYLFFKNEEYSGSFTVDYIHER